jgi:antitoxin MazE
MATKNVVLLAIQRWGNSLAVRIPSAIARSAHFQQGTPVEMTLQEVGVAVKPVGERKLTLDERLALFDPQKHGGEVMASENVGLEKFE